MKPANENEDVKRLREAAEKLVEHFDCVHIFASRCEDGELGGTINVQFGLGNWFARYGQIQQWCVKQDESARIETRHYNEDEER